MTASSHTSTSYANDLSQFVFLMDEGRILYTTEIEENFSVKITQETDGKTDGKTIEELVSAVLSRWSSLSPASRNRKFTVLRGFLNWLNEEGFIEKDWRSHLVGPKVPQKIPHFISVDEVIALFRALTEKREERAPTLLLVGLLYGGGMRVSEACNLKWQDLQVPERSARILGKGQKERVVVLPTLVWFVLNKTKRDSTYVFGDQPLHTRKAYEMVRQAGQWAGLHRPLNPHALRHSFATHLLSSGTDLRILQELLGHKSLVATQKYTHLSLDHLARSVETFHPLSASKLKK